MMVKGKSGNSRQLQNHALTVVEKKCPRCKKDNIVTDSEFGEVICNVCGSVISERIEDTGPEYRNFLDGGPDKSRTGIGTTLTIHDKGLSTIINPTNKDETGNYLSASMKYTMGRLRMWDKRSKTCRASDIN